MKTKLLAISGSLRKASVNTATLSAAQTLGCETIDFNIYTGLQMIPPYNPDDEFAGIIPDEVLKLRREMSEAQGIIIASPEYAHGVSGVMKNALDWVVGHADSIYEKPVALWNVSTRATIAYSHLSETLKTMGAKIIEKASNIIPLPHTHISKAEILANEGLCEKIKLNIEEFYKSLRTL